MASVISPPRWKGMTLILIAFSLTAVLLKFKPLQTRDQSPYGLPSAPRLEKITSPDLALPEPNLAQALLDLEDADSWSRQMTILRTLQDTLKALPSDQATEWISTFLNSHRNVKLHGQFTIDQAGRLSSYPSLRVALLDWLLEIEPTRAAVQGRLILEGEVSPDEWAVSLRNLTVAEGDSAREEVVSKAVQFLSDLIAQANPSPSFFESLDFLVHYQATEKTPLLVDFIQRTDRPDLRKSAFLALNGLVHASPAAMFQALNAQHDLQNSFPEMVAQQMARADLSDPQQAEQIRRYLQDPNRSQADQDAFVAIFPNFNRFQIPTLVSTPVPSPKLSEESIQAQRSQIMQWIANRP